MVKNFHVDPSEHNMQSCMSVPIASGIVIAGCYFGTGGCGIVVENPANTGNYFIAPLDLFGDGEGI